MAKKSPTRPLLAAFGTSFAVSLAVTPIAYAEGNPFAAVEYQGGYMVVADEAKCGASMGEGKCGGAAGDAKTDAPAKTKEADAKAGEGKSGGASGDAKADEDKRGS